MPYLNKKTGVLSEGRPPVIEEAMQEWLQISKAEYHARSLVSYFDDNNYSNEYCAHLEKIIEECEAERTPKPEITDKHIGCVVELSGSEKALAFYHANWDEVIYSAHIPRQAVKLAAHPHDGSDKMPDWLSGEEKLIVEYEKGAKSISTASYFSWSKVIAYQFAVELVVGE